MKKAGDPGEELRRLPQHTCSTMGVTAQPAAGYLFNNERG